MTMLNYYAKLLAKLQKETDEKLDQMLQEIMQKLEETNPYLNINLDESDKLTLIHMSSNYQNFAFGFMHSKSTW